MPVIVPRKARSSSHGPTLTEENKCFSIFLLSCVVSYLQPEKKKEYSGSVLEERLQSWSVSQCCLQQLPSNDQFSNPLFVQWSDGYSLQGQGVLKLE